MTWLADRTNMVGTRVLCQDEEKVVWSVPIEWTDRVEPGLEAVINAGRAPVLVDDLLALSAGLNALCRPPKSP
jgi:hypothetical protein